MFLNNRRLEEDLERIRRANLSPEKDREESKLEKKNEKIARENIEKFGFKDLFAMCIAALSVLIPYFLIFVAVMAGLYFLFFG